MKRTASEGVEDRLRPIPVVIVHVQHGHPSTGAEIFCRDRRVVQVAIAAVQVGRGVMARADG